MRDAMQLLAGEARSIVLYRNHKLLSGVAANMDAQLAALQTSLNAMLNRIFNNGLYHQLRNRNGFVLICTINFPFETIHKPHLHNEQVALRMLQLGSNRHPLIAVLLRNDITKYTTHCHDYLSKLRLTILLQLPVKSL